MRKLDDTLKDWMLGTTAKAGELMGGVPKSSGPRGRKELIANLTAISQRNGQMAWVIVVVLLILFLANLWLILFKGDTNFAKAAIGLLGLSAAGCVERLYKLWSEKSATELLLCLAADLEGEALQAAIKVLVLRASPASNDNAKGNG